MLYLQNLPISSICFATFPIFSLWESLAGQIINHANGRHCCPYCCRELGQIAHSWSKFASCTSSLSHWIKYKPFIFLPCFYMLKSSSTLLFFMVNKVVVKPVEPKVFVKHCTVNKVICYYYYIYRERDKEFWIGPLPRK